MGWVQTVGEQSNPIEWEIAPDKGQQERKKAKPVRAQPSIFVIKVIGKAALMSFVKGIASMVLGRDVIGWLSRNTVSLSAASL